MKAVGKRLLKIVSLALAITLAAALFPYVRDLAARLLPKGKYEQAVQVISHEMEKTGELTALRFTDQEVMENTTNALFIGEVQKVTVPYTYEIGLGVDLSRVTAEAGDGGITVKVPEAGMIFDSFRVSGDPTVSDFFYPLNETRYQEMQDRQAADCRARYLNDPEKMDKAWQAACEALRGLIRQWTGEELPIRFIRAGEKG